MAALNATRRGSTWCAAGSRSLRSGGRPSISTVTPSGPPRASHARYTSTVAQPHGGVTITKARSGRITRARSSPTPRTRIAPVARRQNDTSAPSIAAMRSTSAEVSTAATSDAPMSTAAASAEPPPSPAPGGMPLCSSISTVAPSARARARREVRLVRRHSCRVWPGERDGSRRRRAQHELVVGLAHRNHKCLELVIPVGARARHVQRKRELRERVDANLRRGAGRLDPGDRRPLRECERLGAGRRIDAGAAQHGLRAFPEHGIEGAPQGLAPRGKAAPNELEHPLGIRDRNWRLRVALQPHECAVDLRLRNEHRGRHGPDHVGPAVIGDLHRHRAVGLRAGNRGEPLADLALHHHQQAVDHRGGFERTQHDRRRDVVRQVRHHRPPVVVGQQGGPVDFERVGDHDVDRAIAHHLRQDRREPAIELDRTHRAPAATSARVSEPRPGPTSTTWSPG